VRGFLKSDLLIMLLMPARMSRGWDFDWGSRV